MAQVTKNIVRSPSSGFDDGATFTPSYWFTVEGMQTINAVHNYIDSREETGKVLAPLTGLADSLAGIREHTGREKPTVIT